MSRRLLVPLLLLAALAGCKSPAMVSGTITYREKIALPADAIVKVAIEDVTAADAPPRLVASIAFGAAGRQVPIPYSLTLNDTRDLDPKHQYALRVRIESATGELMFINDTRYGVITNGVTEQDVVVKRVAAP